MVILHLLHKHWLSFSCYFSNFLLGNRRNKLFVIQIVRGETFICSKYLGHDILFVVYSNRNVCLLFRLMAKIGTLQRI